MPTSATRPDNETRLRSIAAVLSDAGFRANIEYPFFLSLPVDADADAYVAAGFDGDAFNVGVQYVSGKTTDTLSTFPADLSVGYLAVAVAMASKRFASMATGGGCEAYSRTIGEIEFLVTDDAALPVSLDSPCTLSSNVKREMDSFREYPSVLEFLRGFDAANPFATTQEAATADALATGPRAAIGVIAAYAVLDSYEALLTNEKPPRSEEVAEIQDREQGELLCYANPAKADFIIRACNAHAKLLGLFRNIETVAVDALSDTEAQRTLKLMGILTLARAGITAATKD